MSELEDWAQGLSTPSFQQLPDSGPLKHLLGKFTTGFSALSDIYMEASEKIKQSRDEIIAQANSKAMATNDIIEAERKDWESEKDALAHMQKFGSLIKLNVGGKKFTTSMATLLRFPESMIGRMFSGRHTIPEDEEGNFFLDRDGCPFENILNFLRSPEDQIDIPTNELSAFIRESRYYGLLQLMRDYGKISDIEGEEEFPTNCRYGVGDTATKIRKSGGVWKVGADDIYVCRSCGEGFFRSSFCQYTKPRTNHLHLVRGFRFKANNHKQPLLDSCSQHHQ